MLCEKCKHLISMSICEKNEDGTYDKRKILWICGVRDTSIKNINIDECNNFEKE